MKQKLTPKILSFFNRYSLIILILIISGCKNFPLVESKRVSKGNSGYSAPHSSSSTPSYSMDDNNDDEETTPSDDTSAPPTSETPAKPTRPNLPPEPKIGVIVGPGFLRSFIAIGILQEFQKARIPVQALIGFEWGSLPAGLYANNGQANEMEWQMLKLNESSVIKKSLIRNQIESHSTSELRDFLSKAFDQRTFEQARIPFECLTFDLKKKQYYWMKTGAIANSLAYCLASPPFSKPYRNNVGASDLKLAAESLKRKGANYIVFINTLNSKEDVLDENFSSEAHVLWSLEQYQLLHSNNFVDFVIETSAAPYKIMDFDSRRDMIRAGQDIGQRAIKKLSAKLKI